MKTKKFFFLILLIFSSFLAFSNSPKWEIVTSGAPVFSPFNTSYGFSFFNDGRMVVSFSNNGTKLYEKRLAEKPSNLVSVTQNDFFYVVSESKKSLTCYNPDGLALWTKHFEQEIISKPQIGFDGRVFVHSKKTAFCFGINGKQKWKLDFSEDVSEKSHTLNDGSLLFFYQKEVDKKTKALRVSPFGQMLEDVTFAGSVVDSIQAQNGLYLLFSEGTIGFCSVNDKKIQSVWAVQNTVNINSTNKSKLFEYNNYVFAASINGEYSLVNTKTKELVFKKANKKIAPNTKDDLTVFFDSQKLIILSKNQNSLYVYSLDYNGKEVFSFEEPISNSDFGFYTRSGYVVILDSNWCVKGFLPYQNIFANQTSDNPKRKMYSQFNFEPSKISKKQYSSVLLAGNYGIEEENIISHIHSELELFVEQQNTSGVVDNFTFPEPSSFSSVIDAMNLACLSEVDFSAQIANVIRSTKDTAILKSAFFYASQNGYDPNHSMINSIENKFFSSFSVIAEDSFYFGLCDSVYNICKTMGSPVLYNQGKRILTKLLTSNFNNKVKNYILQTINNIISLQI